MKGTPLSPDQWRRIVSLFASGEVGMTALATPFGVTHQTIRLALAKRLPYLRGRRQLKRKNPACEKIASSS
jgi:hypothetical protein